VIACSSTFDRTGGSASVVIVAGYAYGLVLVRAARDQPMWRARSTSETAPWDASRRWRCT
jgi:hypothetical protein